MANQGLWRNTKESEGAWFRKSNKDDCVKTYNTWYFY